MARETYYSNLKYCNYEYGRREGEYVNNRSEEISTNLISRTSTIIYKIWG